MKSNQLLGHLSALATMLIWGTTFISTKILLEFFVPVEILVLRFVIGWIVLLILKPALLKWQGLKKELIFAGAGLCGICLYYLLENIALLFTQASNVGVIISVAPFFTALLVHRITGRKLQISFFTGFALAMTGIILISFNGADIKIGIWGELLSLLAAFIWACYSILTSKIGQFGYNIILSTRRTFLYGLICMLPLIWLSDFRTDVILFENPAIIGNLLYLGVGASAFCFVWWNYAVKTLGPIQTSVYIYLVPAITVLFSALILNEKTGWISWLGTILTIAGLVLSEGQKNES